MFQEIYPQKRSNMYPKNAKFDIFFIFEAINQIWKAND
jgi:hypothetical protein